MKGTIVKCLQDLVEAKFGKETWQQSLKDAGLPENSIFMPIADVDDAAVMKVVQTVCKNTKLSLTQAADAFGDHWVNIYTQKMYKPYFTKHKTAKEFLCAMDELHVTMTKTMANAHPPRFEYEWQGENKLIMHYKSSRGMVDFLVGLIKGVGKYYNERLSVMKLGPNKVQVQFM